MSYTGFYGLNQEPFSNAPVTKFYYDSEQHSQALLRLRYAADQMKGLALLVGNIGAGKTTLARRMLDSLPEAQFEAALLVIIHSAITATWILQRIALQLGVEKPAEEKLALLSQLYKRLLQIHREGRKAVVLIDEAQMLQSRELMEEFRGLLNLELPEKKLISFIFFGLPEIEENLRLDPPLQQRVALRCRLEAFDATSTRQYIQHRLRLAGAQRPIFTPEAIDEIHRFSNGVPRVINTFCDNLLFEGSIMKRPVIDRQFVDSVASSLNILRLETVQEVVRVQSPASPPPAPIPADEPTLDFDLLVESDQTHPGTRIEVTSVSPLSSVVPLKAVPNPTPPAAGEMNIEVHQPVVHEEYEEVFERIKHDEAEDIDAVLGNNDEKAEKSR